MPEKRAEISQAGSLQSRRGNSSRCDRSETFREFAWLAQRYRLFDVQPDTAWRFPDLRLRAWTLQANRHPIPVLP